MAESGVCSRLQRRMEPMPGDPHECRQQARECLRLAQEATSEQLRQNYTAFASKWMELAIMFECDNALLKGLNADGLNTLERRRPISLRAA